MTEFESVIKTYEQVGAQYTMFKCGDVQLVLMPYVNFTMVMTFCNYDKMVRLKLEDAPLKEIVRMLTDIGWEEVCA